MGCKSLCPRCVPDPKGKNAEVIEIYGVPDGI
jgi:hypothetical protein